MPGTIIVGVILLAVIGIAVYSTVKRIKYGSNCCGSKDPMPKKVKVKDKNKTHYPYAYRMKVDGMHCSGCVRNIENAFHKKDGMWATVSLENKEVFLRSKNETERKTASEIISSAGFTMLSFEVVQTTLRETGRRT